MSYNQHKIDGYLIEALGIVWIANATRAEDIQQKIFEGLIGVALYGIGRFCADKESSRTIRTKESGLEESLNQDNSPKSAPPVIGREEK
jgi:hypothetical protein